ncbi:MAG: NAD(P)H-dependent oxidoreductase [Rhodothermales bacterium]|nr:NAD(P)H-dependent oxidoreductase [Rhodothermales bacterium]
MNVLIVYCHPEPTSFNAALKDAATESFEAAGDKVEISDLYREGFDPVEKPEHYRDRICSARFEPLSEQRHACKTDTVPKDVSREIERLDKCDLVILQFPMWWHQQPAMLKGWFDRVFVAGKLYTSKMRYSNGYFKGRRAICSVTTGAPIATFTKRGRAGGTIESLLHTINYSLHYMGFEVLKPQLFTEIQGSGFTYRSEEEFQKHLGASLDKWKSVLKNLDNIEKLDFADWKDWDSQGVELDA